MKVIGLTTKYLGEEFPGLCGREVRVLAVLRGALLPYVDRGDAGRCLTDDEDVARAGGVKDFDRVAIAHVQADGSASSVHWAVRAIDLACFTEGLR